MTSPSSNGRTASTISESSAASSNSSAISSEEALSILLSPDGYYTYLSIPKPDPSTIGPRYLSSQSPNSADNADNAVDIDQVKKNYRRLSLKHHPDRKTGDPETFRILTRAKIVLSSPKLRREYDLVGLDLDDDAEEVAEDDEGNASSASGETEKQEQKENSGGKSKTETVMGYLASATLAGILQMVVRTGMMGLVAVLLSRYIVLTFLAIGLLCFVSTRIYSALKQTLPPNTKLNLSTMKDVFSPLIIAFGVFCMYRGRRFLIFPDAVGGEGIDNGSVGDSTTNITSNDALKSVTYLSWSWTFWFGETVVMTCFLSNSFEKRGPGLVVVFTVCSLFLSLWLRGKFWRYATLLGFQGVIALLVVMAFPIMEMVLEEIVQEKMRKVGEKIRAHDARVRELLSKKGG
eukprot:CCRYP_010610-RB/>CCRYP_010610-RB protein AED:0.38 eAED:0.38 QI:198/1/1/1/1/1/2/1266/404